MSGSHAPVTIHFGWPPLATRLLQEQIAMNTPRHPFSLRTPRHHALLATVGLSLAASAQGGTTTLESVGLSGASATGQSGTSRLSADGRFVCFWSEAADLVGSDTNAAWDVFRRDRLTGQVLRVSVDSSGTQGNGAAQAPRISSDGRYVAFTSEASNLVASDTNGVADAFVHDCVTGATQRVNVDSSGAEANGHGVVQSISADGTKILFLSNATNLVATSVSWPQLYLHDTTTGVTTIVSVSTSGAAANPGTVSSMTGTISADGTKVAFDSFAANLVAGDTNGTHDVFLRDLAAGTTVRVSVSSAGAQGTSGSGGPSLSADGSVVTFYSLASNLVAGDTNGTYDQFVRDLGTGTTTLVSVSSAGGQGSGTSLGITDAAISADGRHVVFRSDATDLVAGDTNGASDVFVHDRLTATTLRASLTSAGAESLGSSAPITISADGRFVTFTGDADDLTAGDANGLSDVFVHDRWSLVVPGCFGNTAQLRMTSSAATIGASVAIQLSAAVYASGTALLYFGADGRDAAGCGTALSGIGEALLAFSPAPFLLNTAATSGGVANLGFVVPNNPALAGMTFFVQAANVSSTSPNPIEMSTGLGLILSL